LIGGASVFCFLKPLLDKALSRLVLTRVLMTTFFARISISLRIAGCPLRFVHLYKGYYKRTLHNDWEAETALQRSKNMHFSKM